MNLVYEKLALHLKNKNSGALSMITWLENRNILMPVLY